jgi:hypothetical protein
LTPGRIPVNLSAVTPDREADRFLRAAVKTALRLQRNETADQRGQGPKAGVQTLRRIKASLQKRTSNSKTHT